MKINLLLTKISILEGGGRNTSLDWLGGLLIIHMILGHISQSHYAQVEDAAFFVVVNRIFFFFMPWFFFKSGMFFKRNTNQQEFICKSFKRLMVPFIVFSFIGEPLYWVHIAFSEHAEIWQWYLASIKTIVTHGQMQGNGPLWFLLSLFLIRIFYNKFGVNTGIKIFILFLSLLVLCSSHYLSINLFPSISHTLAGLVFYILGDLMRNLQYNKLFFFISSIVVVFIFIVFPIDSYVLYGNAVFPDKYYYWIFLYSLVAIIVVHNVLKYLPADFFKWLPLQIVGRDSMIYYVTHLLWLNVCRIICADILKVDQWIYFWIMVVSCVIMLSLFARFFRKEKYKKWVGA